MLYQAYSAKGRNPAVGPKTMFRILTYAYSQNIYSSRKIETACRQNINFMWLFAVQKASDHSTIARFRTGFLADACENLFYQMVCRLEASEELSKETMFIDGTKLEVCANKYTFVWKKSVGKWEAKMYERIQEVVCLLNQEYICGFRVEEENANRNDVWTLVPFLKHMEANLGFRYPSVTADSGYESEESYEYLKRQGQTPYIKPQTYGKWKKRSFKKDISKRENMAYDEETDTYTYHAGKRLKEIFKKKQKSKSGYLSKVTVYECEDCGGRLYKEKCTRAKGNKRRYLSKNFLKKRQESYENSLSKKGILYRTNRSIQVEGAFGVLKTIMNSRDFC